MVRGILGGMLFGGAVSISAAGVISVVLDPPTRPELAVDTPAAVNAPDVAEEAGEARLGDSDLARDATAPQVSAPDAEEAEAFAEAGEDTPTVPEAAATDSGLQPATDVPTESDVVADLDEPVLPAPQAAIPEAPAAEPELSIPTEPAAPLRPAIDAPSADATTLALAAPDQPETPSSIDRIIDVEDAPSVQAAEQAAAQATEQAAEQVAAEQFPEQTAAETASETAPVAGAIEAGEATEDPAKVPEDAVETATDVPAAAEAETPVETAAAGDTETPDASEETAPETDAAADGDRIAALSNETIAEDGRPAIGRPASSLIDRNAQASEAEAAETPDTDTENVEPLVTYAVPFDNPEAKPLMSIILIDEGENINIVSGKVAALSEFPAALSIAVNAGLADAQERMRLFREAGYEVLALLDLPPRATAVDAEVNVAAALQALPEAVALLEGTSSGLQESRDAAEQLVVALKDSGHGVVLQAKGLNAVQKMAEQGGVPSQLVFRDFDSAGQSTRVIRRFLDQAAFRSRQEGSIVMLGRLQPDTISALLQWGFQERAQRVALAPISAVLTK